MHWAAALSNAETVITLLEAGANGKARDENNRTPYDLAKQNENLLGTDALKMLDEARY